MLEVHRLNFLELFQFFLGFLIKLTQIFHRELSVNVVILSGVSENILVLIISAKALEDWVNHLHYRVLKDYEDQEAYQKQCVNRSMRFAPKSLPELVWKVTFRLALFESYGVGRRYDPGVRDHQSTEHDMQNDANLDVWGGKHRELMVELGSLLVVKNEQEFVNDEQDDVKYEGERVHYRHTRREHKNAP